MMFALNTLNTNVVIAKAARPSGPGSAMPAVGDITAPAPLVAGNPGWPPAAYAPPASMGASCRSATRVSPALEVSGIRISDLPVGSDPGAGPCIPDVSDMRTPSQGPGRPTGVRAQAPYAACVPRHTALITSRAPFLCDVLS